MRTHGGNHKAAGLILAATGAAGAILILDLTVPPGFAVPMLYVIPMMMTWFAAGREGTYFLAGSVLLFTWLGMFPYQDVINLEVVANRSMASVLLLVLSALLVKQKRLVEESVAAHEARHESEDQFRAAFDISSIGMCQMQPLTGRLIRVNRQICLMTGYREAELLDRTFFDITESPDHSGSVDEYLRLVRSEISEYRRLHRFVRHDGGEIWGEVTINLMRDTSGKPLRSIAVIQNVSERMWIEKRLRASEERFRKIFENAGMGIAIGALDGRFVQCNPAYCKILGYTEDELRQKTFQQLIHPDDLEHNMALVRDLHDHVIPSFEIDNRYITKSGAPVWAHKYVSLLRADDGTVTHYVALVTDITERKRDDEVLRTLNTTLEQRVIERASELVKANERFEWVTKATQDGIWDWDFQQNTVYLSPRWKEMHGFHRDEMVEMVDQWSARIHPDDQERVIARLQDYLSGQHHEYWEEYRVRRKDGTHMWVLDRGVVLLNEQGRAVRMVGAETDITWRKEAEETLRRSEREFRMLADNVPAFFGYIGPDRRYRYVNKRYEDLYGLPDSEILKMTVEELLGSEGYATVRPYLEMALSGKATSFDYRLVVPGSGEYWFSAQYVPDVDSQGQIIGVIVLLADITQLKISETALREREAQLRDLSAKLLQAHEEERRRIALDIHDDFTQRLAAFAIDLKRISRADTQSKDVVLGELSRLRESAERMTDDLQRLAHQLHPSILEHVGLEAAIRELVEEFASRTGLAMEVMVQQLPTKVPLEYATCLYRVLQECLQNVRKHAHATNILVRVVRTNHGIGLCIHDDGQGFDWESGIAHRKGLGLTSMEERVRLLDGKFRIRTKPGNGTEVHAWVPLPVPGMIPASVCDR